MCQIQGEDEHANRLGFARRDVHFGDVQYSMTQLVSLACMQKKLSCKDIQFEFSVLKIKTAKLLCFLAGLWVG